MKAEKLSKLFNPGTVAVIGASNKKDSVGLALMENLVGKGFEGTVYPINPKSKSIQGVKAYPTISEAPDKIDLAIIATPAAGIPAIVEDCGVAGVQNIIIISAGFAEGGEEGEELLKSVLATAKKYDMRVMGPNCLGFIRPSLNLNATFAKSSALPGKIAFISQSGALGTAVLDWAIKQNVGFSHFVSIGSMADIGFHDLIDYFGHDPHTSSILIYMESLTHARKFLSAARAFARAKPIIVLKVGKSSEGAKAAMSHTGTLAGNDDVFNAAFKRAGIIRVDTINELFNCAQTLASQPRPAGNKLGIITNAGGPGVIATDSLMELGGQLAELAPETLNKLNYLLPKNWSKNNPIDVLGDAGPDRYRGAIDASLNDPNVDGILVILTPQAMTNPLEVAKSLIEIKTRKTILTSWMGEKDVSEARELLSKNNIPVFEFPEEAVKCFISMSNYSSNLHLLYETPASMPHQFRPNLEANKKLIDGVFKQNRNTLTEAECRELLLNYEIPVVKSGVASSEKEVEKIAEEVGYPLVIKILSPDILHKTDVGGVVLNIQSTEEAKEAYRKIMASVKKNVPDAAIHGVNISKMETRKYELLIGCKKDPIFGPTIVFGMGGVAVEVFRDTNIGLPPLNMALAMRIIEETKIFKLIKGYRGMKGVDISSIQFLLYKFAYLVMDLPEIKEIDINPFAVDENGGVVLDAKVVLDQDFKSGQKPYSHMVISPYPQQYVKEFEMKNGEVTILRPIRPEDEPLEAEMFRSFSEQTQRFRFFGLIKDITHELLVRYTQIDYDREMAIIAEVEEVGVKKMAGVVRLIADSENETAEYAIVVADPWQNLGLGNEFTDYILDIASQKGIKKVYANVLKDNFIMAHMFRKRGFKVVDQGDSYYAEKELQKEGSMDDLEQLVLA